MVTLLSPEERTMILSLGVEEDVLEEIFFEIKHVEPAERMHWLRSIFPDTADRSAYHG